MGKVQLALFLSVFSKKVTTVLCPMQALVERSRFAAEKHLIVCTV